MGARHLFPVSSTAAFVLRGQGTAVVTPCLTTPKTCTVYFIVCFFLCILQKGMLTQLYTLSTDPGLGGHLKKLRLAGKGSHPFTLPASNPLPSLLYSPISNACDLLWAIEQPTIGLKNKAALPLPRGYGWFWWDGSVAICCKNQPRLTQSTDTQNDKSHKQPLVILFRSTQPILFMSATIWMGNTSFSRSKFRNNKTNLMYNF